MPELPEVETTLRGIEKKVLNKKIISFVSREKKLRWIIPTNINKNVAKNGFKTMKTLSQFIKSYIIIILLSLL